MRLSIINGTVLDGTGAAPVQEDVLVEDDTIADLAPAAGFAADRTINAQGKIVCPGFIDVHTHSDAYILIAPEAPSKIHQGITTEVVGNCGASCAPLHGESRMPSDWTAHTYPGSWHTVAEYRQILEQVGPGLNIVLLVGHNTLRAGVMGYAPRAASPTELRRMQQHLEQALAEGARGLSTGLVYNPGRFSAASEIQSLARVVADHGGIYTSHMRSESSKLLEAIDETLSVAAATGVRTQISHLKAYGQANWHLLDPALDRIRGAREQGLDVWADRYPYTASCTDLDIILPDWIVAGGPDAILDRLRDPQTKARLIAELKQKPAAYWKSITIGSTVHPDNRAFAGTPLVDIARSLACHPAEAAIEMALKDELRTAAFFHGMHPDNLRKVLVEPYVMIGSDASLRAPSGPLSHDWPHPRAYGTFPRFLRMALDGQTVPLPEAIRKMTSLPANTFRLHQRGILHKGYKADIIVFDPATVRDRADFLHPHAIADGIDHVLVNGSLAVHHGQRTGQRNGRFL